MTACNDGELFEQIRASLYTAVIGDVLDSIGRFHQFLPQPIRPLRDDMKFVGRAMPVVIEEVEGHQSEPFGKLTEALDQMQPGEVYLATASPRSAAWGEIMTAAARSRGAVGAVIDGFHRDTNQVLAQNWPVFSRGAFAQDAAVRSSVTAYRCPVKICQVQIDPGDLIFGDIDGVLIVPCVVERQVLEAAFEKARAEKVVRREIEAGASVTATFRRYRIL